MRYPGVWESAIGSEKNESAFFRTNAVMKRSMRCRFSWVGGLRLLGEGTRHGRNKGGGEVGTGAVGRPMMAQCRCTQDIMA